ncbi:MAG TPA: hypothetical protein VJ508_02735, partial [Saprospiraceae bacterium]|nr:hypothetical protein [Saprospiraceae bacterium]
IRNASAASISGFQFTLSDPDLEFLGIRGWSADISNNDYAIIGDQMTVSWFTVKPVTMSDGELMFTILARAKKSGNLQHTLSLDSHTTPAEVYGDDETVYAPKLDFTVPNQDQMMLYPCEPNPWKDECVIPIYLPLAGKVKFSVLDLSGKVMMTQMKEYEMGYHEIQLHRNDFSHVGLMMYSVESDMGIICGKMLISE